MGSFRQNIFLLLIFMGIMIGCAQVSSSPFGNTLEAQIASQILFTQVAQDPQTFIGKTLKVGGEVLSAKRLSDRTEIMMLQIPLNEDSVPVSERTRSLGRFVATQEAFLDPATVPSGTRLTIIGEITGQTTVRVDEEDQTYPVLAIKALHVWPVVPAGYYSYARYPWRPGPFWGSYWGPGPYWSPYWSFPRSSYWYGRRHSGMRRGRR
ncbi:MAG: Slp family lipoprotein [Nitrospirales bacterium]